MAKGRRTFSLDIIDTDNFLDMSLNAQLLYFHLGMRADDEGFITSPKKIVRSVKCTEAELIELENKGYIITFDSGIIVIKHWRKNNHIRKERKNSTIHKEEFESLIIKDEIYYKKDNNIIKKNNDIVETDRKEKNEEKETIKLVYDLSLEDEDIELDDDFTLDTTNFNKTLDNQENNNIK